ncbi:GNAT family N-acetyltransferase [Rouxiella badensis]|jgi:ribosomal protein S18 acetylase RimI-like enzyme|uniref:GNAT family N-acetyltransferase n=1 Tax=Rouxiella badensis TaxID=1646377 RepID=UPI0013EF14E1|nr:GNAT family N-acetyltransferase [Rouxiella badensis]MCC3718461.1 GNAT family N-acetyltransferase [Rouxiella badensis]MCC3726771.1 GNAT family N-acetyltransferase [Rouxiella badensis]MCC3738880.1 GNAT family N-acetyltransferase [Rouxiella badensis]QII37647.1 GNAT family N-acetyltransferase [Rouxiella badensis]
MSLSIAVCEKLDWKSMMGIFTEMEEHYFGAGIIEPSKMETYLESRVFAPDSGVIVIRVKQDEAIIGFACVNILYPSPRYSGQMYIKELYISAAQRGQGVGRRLMQYIARLAVERECLRLDWMSEKSNAGSARFYRSLGGETLDGMFHFRLFGESLHNLADK